MLDSVLKMIEEVNSTNAATEKIAKLRAYQDDPVVKMVLELTYSVHHKFYVTSANLKKNSHLCLMAPMPNLFGVLKCLEDRSVTGHQAIAWANGWCEQNPKYTELFHRIVDGNLKIRLDASNINKAIPGCIPVFSIPLAEDYTPDRKLDLREWIASRKYNGARLLIEFDENGTPSFKSRVGLPYDKLYNNLLPHLPKLKNKVLDGEACIVDENGMESFSAMQRVLTRKDYTIERPKFYGFDCVDLDVFNKGTGGPIFSERLKELGEILRPVDSRIVDFAHQVLVEDEEHLAKLGSIATSSGWEGLIIKRDVPWKGKRTLDMLKVKAFKDAEYPVVDVKFSKMRIIKDGQQVEVETLKCAVIEHKGKRVDVGSGWSQEQRLHYFANPHELIGKTLTVQYFEETTDINGENSLQFPTVKAIYDGIRES